jgi:branched-subunit amino acid ABC-type transport system permease component
MFTLLFALVSTTQACTYQLTDTAVYAGDRYVFFGDSIEFSLLLVSGFIAAVIGGLDSLLGAVLGGLILGIAISFILMYVSSALFFIAPFVILLLVLFIRPHGIIGVKAGRRA